MNEFELIDRYFRRAIPDSGAVLLGIGDDCALLRPPLPGQVLAISTDLLLEGRHFFAGTDPTAVGHKALAVNLSDLGAMGAQPLGFTLSLALPAIEETWIAAFCAGLFALADRFNCPLVGGDTTRGPLAISITVFGQVPPAQALRRDRARSGDEIWVSGALGGASYALAARSRGDEEVDAGAARRLDWPQPQVELGMRLRGTARAAIDLSDGLAGDLRHVLVASSKASESAEELMAELDVASIPLDPSLSRLPPREALDHALYGGDDYELVFTAAPSDHEQVRTLWPTAGMIGRLRSGRGILLIGNDGRSEPLDRSGFDHFAR